MDNYKYDCHEYCRYGGKCRIFKEMHRNPFDCDEFLYWDHMSDDEKTYREDDEEE